MAWCTSSARVSARSGMKLDGTGVNISGTKEPGYGSVTAVVWDGVNWRVTWSDITTFWIARVNTAGVVLDPGSVAVASVQTGPTPATAPGGCKCSGSSSRISTTTSSPRTFHRAMSPARAGHSPSVRHSKRSLTSPPAATVTCWFIEARFDSGRVLAQPLDAAVKTLTAEPIQLIRAQHQRDRQSKRGVERIAVSRFVGCAQRDRRSTLVGHRCQAGPRAVHGDERLFRLGGCGCIGKRLPRHRAEGWHQHQSINPVAAHVSGAGVVLDASRCSSAFPMSAERQRWWRWAVAGSRRGIATRPTTTRSATAWARSSMPAVQ